MMFELRVLSGLHLGAALPLFGESWLIGQAEGADLLLSDNGVAEQHCVLRRDDDRWQLQKMQGDIRLPQGETVASVEQLAISDPFAIGDAWLCVAAADSPWQPFTPPAVTAPEEPTLQVTKQKTKQKKEKKQGNKGSFPRWISGLVLSLVLLFTFTVVSWILQPTIAQTRSGEPTRKRLDTAKEMRMPLLTMLRERDLASVVSVTVNDKSVTLKGKLDKDQMLIFTRMLARFTSEYMTGAPLNNQVQPLKLELPFRIVQITTGPQANIVTADGQRMFIGDERDNLRLLSISGNRIEFGGRDNIKVSW